MRLLISDLVAAGRGATTIPRIVAVLSSVLGDAVRQRRIAHNPALTATLPKIEKAELPTWSLAETVQFLDHVAEDRLGLLFDVLIGCGLRWGEALALQWADVYLDLGTLVVRRTLCGATPTPMVISCSRASRASRSGRTT